MAWGGGFFWRDQLAGNFTRTNTYTLYSTLPPPPVGPRFCPWRTPANMAWWGHAISCRPLSGGWNGIRGLDA